MTRRAIGLAAIGLVAAAIMPATAVAQAQERQIVVLKASVSDPVGVASDHARRFGVRTTFVYRHALKGYAATIPGNKVDDVRADDRVAYVESDGEMQASVTQAGATWGLDRVDQQFLPLSGTYSYTNTGAGVTAYIIDTGIRFSHSEFGGRAVSGFDAV